MKYLYKALHFVERAAAYAQGKGYGAGSIESECKAAFFLLGKKPSLVIDVGGNIGKYSLMLKKLSLSPSLEIHIFEPSLINYNALIDLFKDDKSVVVNNLAISDRNGSATLFSDVSGSGLGSLNKRRLDHFNITFDVSESVRTICLDDYWEDHCSQRPIDILKIDIEGFELLALKGASKSIPKCNVIQFEFGGCNIDTKTYFQDFWYFFKDSNFSLYRITPFGTQQMESYSETDESFMTTNYIAKNNNPSWE